MSDNELNEEEQDDLLNSNPETPWDELEDEDNIHQNL